MNTSRTNTSSLRLGPHGIETKDRRTEIRDKARDIFVRHGYRKTTIEDIGHACGLGKAALYHYFTSKEAIFAEVVRAESESLLERMRGAVAEVDDPKDKIIVMAMTRFKILGEFLIGTGMEDDFSDLLPLAASARQVYFQKEAKMLESILAEGQRRGIFKPMKLHSLPIVMISAFRGLETHLAEVQDAPLLNEGMNELLRLFFEGICT